MEPERWRRIEDIFQEALDCEPGRRDSLLDEACAPGLSFHRKFKAM
jgi:hypothetical protein